MLLAGDTIATKSALPICGATFLAGSKDATTFVVADGALVLIITAAYVCVAGWTATPASRTR